MECFAETWNGRETCQPRSQPMVEPMEREAMEEEGLMTPGRRLTVAEQVGEKPRVEMESCSARVVQRIQRANVEQMAQAAKLQAGIRKAGRGQVDD